MQYNLRMASLGIVALAFEWLTYVVETHPGHSLRLLFAVAVGIGVANALAGWLLFAPIHAGLTERGSTGRAVERVARLPALSALWAYAISAIGMTLPFALSHDARTSLVYQGLLMSIHSVLFGLFTYFMVDDFTPSVTAKLNRGTMQEMPTRRGGVATKLLAAYFATAAVPFVLIFFDVYFAERLYGLDRIDLREAFLLDMIGAMVVAAVAVAFMRRGMLRSLKHLLAAMQRVDAGDLTTRAPVASNDEFGLLTSRFNQMVGQLRERNLLRDTLGRYVSTSVADAILAKRGTLVPEQRFATILFTDIQDFTRIAERLPAQKLVTLLNEYFSLLVEIVERHGGVVNQIQGDALLVSFNVPLDDVEHATNAVRAAVEIERDANHRVFGEGIRLITRIGVNSGHVIAGPVGAEHRLVYTVHGDAVNLAARLEELNKQFDTRILVAETTRRLADRAFEFISLGEATVRGRSERIPVYTLRPDPV